MGRGMGRSRGSGRGGAVSCTWPTPSTDPNCDQVLVVHDVPLDAPCLRMLRAAQMLRARLPDLSTLTGAVPPPAAPPPAAGRGDRGDDSRDRDRDYDRRRGDRYERGDRGERGERGERGDELGLAATDVAAAAVLEHQPQLVFVGNRMPMEAWAQRGTMRKVFDKLFNEHALGTSAAAGANSAGANGSGGGGGGGGDDDDTDAALPWASPRGAI